MVQVGVIGAELVGEEHSLIDERAAGERHGVEADVVSSGLAVDGVGDDFAQDVELALEIGFVLNLRPAADEDLPMGGLGLDHRHRETGIVGRHVAPAEQLQPFGIDHAGDHGFAIDALRVVARHEHVADSVMAGLGELDPKRRANLFEEGMRDLHQDAGAVAGKRVGPGRAAMGEVLQNLQAMLDDLVARPRLQIGDETDAASVVLARRIIESLRRRGARPQRSQRTSGILTGCHCHMQPRPRLAPQARAGPEKLWPTAGPSLAESAQRPKAKNRLLRRLASSLANAGPRSRSASRRRRRLGVWRRSLPNKGQQACPIRPQNDRFPICTQAGFRALFTPVWRHCDLTGR